MHTLSSPRTDLHSLRRVLPLAVPAHMETSQHMTFPTNQSITLTLQLLQSAGLGGGVNALDWTGLLPSLPLQKSLPAPSCSWDQSNSPTPLLTTPTPATCHDLGLS